MMRSLLLAALTLSVPMMAAAEPQVLLGAEDSGLDLSAAKSAVRSRGFEPLVARDLLKDELSELQAQAQRVSEKVEKALKRADAAYLEQRWKASLAALSKAEKLALRLPEPESSLGDIAFKRGVALTARGKKGDARRARTAFALCLAIDPDRRPPRGVYGPDVSREFAAALAARQNQVSGKRRIAVEPAGARVFVDGRRQKGGHARLRGNTHVLRVFAPGYIASTRVVTKKSIAPIKLKKDPAKLRVRVAKALLRADLSARSSVGRRMIRRFAKSVGIASSIWVSQRPIKARLLGAKNSASAGGADVAGAVEKVAARIGGDGEARAKLVANKDEGSSVTGKWWFWASVAGGAAAIAVTAVVLSSGSDAMEPGGPGGNGRINIGIVDP